MNLCAIEFYHTWNQGYTGPQRATEKYLSAAEEFSVFSAVL